MLKDNHNNNQATKAVRGDRAFANEYDDPEGRAAPKSEETLDGEIDKDIADQRRVLARTSASGTEIEEACCSKKPERKAVELLPEQHRRGLPISDQQSVALSDATLRVDTLKEVNSLDASKEADARGEAISQTPEVGPDKDSLLCSLLQKHPEAEGRWTRITEEFNTLASLATSKATLQRRSRKPKPSTGSEKMPTFTEKTPCLATESSDEVKCASGPSHDAPTGSLLIESESQSHGDVCPKAERATPTDDERTREQPCEAGDSDGKAERLNAFSPNRATPESGPPLGGDYFAWIISQLDRIRGGRGIEQKEKLITWALDLIIKLGAAQISRDQAKLAFVCALNNWAFLGACICESPMRELSMWLFAKDPHEFQAGLTAVNKETGAPYCLPVYCATRHTSKVEISSISLLDPQGFEEMMRHRQWPTRVCETLSLASRR